MASIYHDYVSVHALYDVPFSCSEEETPRTSHWHNIRVSLPVDSQPQDGIQRNQSSPQKGTWGGGRGVVVPQVWWYIQADMCVCHTMQMQITYLRGSSKCSLPQLDPHVLAGHKTRLVVRWNGDLFIMQGPLYNAISLISIMHCRVQKHWIMLWRNSCTHQTRMSDEMTAMLFVLCYLYNSCTESEVSYYHMERLWLIRDSVFWACNIFKPILCYSVFYCYK